jgi:hypothetical protein
MNFIAFDAAYSLYPRATFEECRALSFASLDDRDIQALGKYARRGWSIIANIWPHELDSPRFASFCITKERWVKDPLSWVVPLDMTGVEPRPPLLPMSERFDWDPAVHNSWSIIKWTNGSKMFMAYHVLKPTIFRYAYLVSDLDLIVSMKTFLREQGSLEHGKSRFLTAAQKAASWTW